MKRLKLTEVKEYVQSNIVRFHNDKLLSLREMDFRDLLRKKNPYLFKAKNLNLPQDLVTSLLDASLSSSEEEIFGNFLEELAIFIIGRTANGWKSNNKGLDLEFQNNGIHYLVSVKSGPNWGNNSQQTDQQEDFERAVKVSMQSKQSLPAQPVLGICYGKTKTNLRVRGAMKVVGQNFWYLLSENKNLYIDIIEPLGVEARKHNEMFYTEKEKIIAWFTDQFNAQFTIKGMVDWIKLVEFCSGNLDLAKKGGKLVIVKPVRRKTS